LALPRTRDSFSTFDAEIASVDKGDRPSGSFPNSEKF
jgi:hypothetical protein